MKSRCAGWAASLLAVAAIAAACGPRSSQSPHSAPTGPEIRYDQYGNEIAPHAADAAPTESASATDAGVGPLPDPPSGANGRIVEREDGTCWFVTIIDCPPKAPCKPPPPLQVNCKDG